MPKRSQPPSSRVILLDSPASQLEVLQERRRVLELELEQRAIDQRERQLLETEARTQAITRRHEQLAYALNDTPHPLPEDGVDYERARQDRDLLESYGAYGWLDTFGPGGEASTWGQPLGYGMQPYLNPLSTRVDRAKGRDRPFVITEIDLGFIRGIARIVCQVNCPAQGVLRNLVNYTVGGRGFQYAFAPKRVGDKPVDGLMAAVQEVLDEFLERTKWCGAMGKEGELLMRTRRDGEYFLQTHCDHVGRTDLRIIEPEQITEQGASDWTAEALADYGVDVGQSRIDCTFGMLTAAHDVTTVYGASAWFDDLGESDFLPAASLQHFKLSDTNIKRGISDFYGALKYLQKSDNLLTKTADGASFQAAIAGIRKHMEGVTRDDVAAFRASKTDYTNTAYMPGGGSRTFNNYGYPGASLLDMPFGMDWVDPPPGHERGPAFVDVAQAMLRWVATQWAMPEFMISGDSSNANYSSTLVSEAPFVKNIQALQFGYGSYWHDLMWLVIGNAARYGRFDRFGEAGSYWAIRKMLKLHVSFPTIETRDRKSETDRLKVLDDDGVISRKKRAAEEGYDYDEEVAAGAKPKPSEITAKADQMDSSGAVTSLAEPKNGERAGTGDKVPARQPQPDDKPEANPTETASAVQPSAMVDINGYGQAAGLVRERRKLHETAPDIRAAIKAAADATERNPTDAQKESGNYRMGRFSWYGLPVTIESPKGATRRKGDDWSIRMPAHYGYFRRTESGADGDAVDVFIGPDPESQLVFVVDQVRADGSFDEHKCLIGYLNETDALEAYKSAYPDGWKVGPIAAMTLGQFKEWLAGGDTSKPLALHESAPPITAAGRLARRAAELWETEYP